MSHQDTRPHGEADDRPLLAQAEHGEVENGRPDDGQPDDDWDDWAAAPGSLQDDLWDAFELDDETADPQPEYGDFWGEPADDEPV